MNEKRHNHKAMLAERKRQRHAAEGFAHLLLKILVRHDDILAAGVAGGTVGVKNVNSLFRIASNRSHR